jgi:hypothetical protein
MDSGMDLKTRLRMLIDKREISPYYNQLRAEYKRLKPKRKPKETDVSKLKEVATAITNLKLGLKGS